MAALPDPADELLEALNVTSDPNELDEIAGDLGLEPRIPPRREHDPPAHTQPDARDNCPEQHGANDPIPGAPEPRPRAIGFSRMSHIAIKIINDAASAGRWAPLRADGS